MKRGTMKHERVLFLAVVSVVAALTVSTAWAFQTEGLIKPSRVVNVGSPHEGVLATVNLDRGDTVKAGQVVAALHSNVEKAAMDLKRAQKDYAERKKHRMRPLFDQGVIPAEEMDEAETERVMAEADLKHATEIVRRLDIRSTINGVVVERYMSPGEYVENQPILQVAQIDPLHVELILPADRYETVRVGMKAEVIPEKPAQGRYEAVVSVVDRVIDAASGTFGVRLVLPNPEHALPAGLKCTVVFPDGEGGS